MSQAKESTWLGIKYSTSTEVYFRVMVPVGGSLQDQFSFTGFLWEPQVPRCASYFEGTPANPPWHQIPSTPIGDEFNSKVNNNIILMYLSKNLPALLFVENLPVASPVTK